MMTNRGSRAYQGYLRDDAVTIAEVLKQRWLPARMMSGKWHVGGEYVARQAEDWTARQPRLSPCRPSAASTASSARLAGAGSFFHPHALMEDGEFMDRVPRRFLLHRCHQRQSACDMIERCSSGCRTAPSSCTSPIPRPTGPCTLCPRTSPNTKARIAAGWDTLRQHRTRRT